jgi:hypothetical protein
MGLPRSRLSVFLIGLLVTAAGLTPMLAALDVIPSPESSFHAPRWIAFLAGSLFFMVGMWIVMQGIVGEERARVFGGAMAFALVLGLAFLINWVAFGSGSRESCSGTTSFLGFGSSRAAAEFECRAAFGYGALLLDFIALRALAGWLSGTSFSGNRAGRALAKISEWGVVLLLLPLVLLAFLLQGLQGASERIMARLRGKPPTR